MTADTSVIDQVMERDEPAGAFQPPAAVREQRLPAHAVRQMSAERWRMIVELAQVLEVAGQGTSILPKDIRTWQQVAVIIKKGDELGLSEMYSLEQIGLANGKPVVQAQAFTAIIKHAHGPSAIQVVESDDERAIVEFHRQGDKPWRIEWTIAMAGTAGLKDKSGPWKQYPRTMLRWRAIAEGARVYFADTVAGLYLPDELGVPVQITPDGDMVIDQEAWGAEQKQLNQPPEPASTRPSTAASAPAGPLSFRDQLKTELIRLTNGTAEDKAAARRAQQWMYSEFKTSNLGGLSDDDLARVNREFRFVDVSEPDEEPAPTGVDLEISADAFGLDETV